MSNHEPPVPPPAFLSSSRPTLNTVLYLATLSRLLTWLLAYLCNLFVDDYDSASDTILPPLSSFPLVNYFARPALAVILRWDAFYFLHIAEEGYVYEQEHAFFPLVPALARVVARIVLRPIVWLLSDRYAILIAGALIANISFVLAAGALYRLTYAIYPTQPRLAFLTAVAYIITPSGMFMTAFYTESPFALLTFWGMYEWARGRNWQAAVAWGMAGFVRSNAVVYIGFFVWDGTVMWFKDRRLYGFQSMISHLFTTICCSLMVLCGFVGFQWYGYQEYCVDFTPVRPWCNATAPLLYSFVQREYWNNGFLRYYEIKQIPNFLFAAPMIGLSFVGIYSYARHDWRRFLTLGLRSCLNSTTTSPYHTNARLLPFVYLWLVLVLYCVTNMHVQVITRFFSSVPGVYWFVAEVWSGAQEKHGWADKVMTRCDFLVTLWRPRNVPTPSIIYYLESKVSCHLNPSCIVFAAMSAVAQKKKEERNQQIMRDLLKLQENKKCFDCPTKGPVYVNLNTQTFVCAKCSGLVREIGHRVKSISASIFTSAEVTAMQVGGNGIATRVWLARYHATGPEPEYENELREFMRQKYVEKKWVDEVALREQLSKVAAAMKSEIGLAPKPTTTTPQNPLAAYTAQQQAEYQRKHFPPEVPKSPHMMNQQALYQQPHLQQMQPQQPVANQYIPALGGVSTTAVAAKTVNLLGDEEFHNPASPSGSDFGRPTASPITSPTTNKFVSSPTQQAYQQYPPLQQPQSPNQTQSRPTSLPAQPTVQPAQSVFSELAQLQQPQQQLPQYSGGILKPSNSSSTKSGSATPTTPNANASPNVAYANANTNANTNAARRATLPASSLTANDPYAALRSLDTEQQLRTVAQQQKEHNEAVKKQQATQAAQAAQAAQIAHQQQILFHQQQLLQQQQQYAQFQQPMVGIPVAGNFGMGGMMMAAPVGATTGYGLAPQQQFVGVPGANANVYGGFVGVPQVGITQSPKFGQGGYPTTQSQPGPSGFSSLDDLDPFGKNKRPTAGGGGPVF